MNKTNKYKVTLEFEVAINPVIVPDINTFEKMSSQKEDGGANDLKLREALKKKGLAARYLRVRPRRRCPLARRSDASPAPSSARSTAS